MAKRRRVNPSRRPATQADVEKAKRRATGEAIDAAWAIFFTALRDKEGFGPKRLRRVWDEVNAVSDSISQGYVDVRDLMQALRDEAGIALGSKETERVTPHGTGSALAGRDAGAKPL